MEAAQKWYIVKNIEGTCEILPSQKVENQDDPNIVERWGPFQTPEEAIARRVGLIRAGKCQPQ
ncbi:MAG: DDE transposase family protein [Oscillatoriaceae bacterium SKW80]|nr:DDE transposase family protein [Oscillatoriaceae bacterium SKYG93]MCX8119309.1 DDE transposase family protein [Oscillatoriaceae bacterium SKW80]MDW8454776.1 DDE transposase family protein [Oscillatoriaceae cyanobacterium SKYGB_i_bin93]HIK28443.1 DDE transposase family protein [Oscillatoriaceae cyanobacterium M7585_C2015_266]